jgi:NTP pyrophosphatase (non-canonical NTP hydrolase)
MNMYSKETEVMDILQEECAEVIQMISKCRRFGIDNQHLKADRPNREKLTEEIGDLLCMIQLAQEFGIVDADAVQAASVRKQEKLRVWSNIFKNDI